MTIIGLPHWCAWRRPSTATSMLPCWPPRWSRPPSCPASLASGKAITTIEGLSSDRSHPLQLAWIAEQVPQCGYCQSGMLMAAAALLREVPRPTPEEIDAAITNLCRCGTYQRVRRAIDRAIGQVPGASR